MSVGFKFNLIATKLKAAKVRYGNSPAFQTQTAKRPLPSSHRAPPTSKRKASK